MDSASRQLLSKFEVARNLFTKAPAAFVDAATVNVLNNELNALEMRFALTTSHLFITASNGETGRMAANSEFARILASEDFSGAVDALVSRSEAIFRQVGVVLREDSAVPKKGKPVAAKPGGRGAARVPAAVSADIQRLIDSYPRAAAGVHSPAEGGATCLKYDSCPACGGEMAVDASRSELRCCDSECGAIRELVGTVFDDSQFYSQEGQKAKSGTFNPNRHFQFWWMHILAREPEEEIGDKDDEANQFGEKLLDELRQIVTRNRMLLRMLTVNDVRAMLRETNRTDLNKNVPLILKKLTGVGPPQVSEAIAVRVENLFTKAIEIGEKVRRQGRVNRNYYPFYIMKILDQILPEDDLDTRRVLYYIYIQRKETVEADDEDWEIICGELAEIQYAPTDRAKMLQYRPN